jgi:hypothetical protein
MVMATKRDARYKEEGRRESGEREEGRDPTYSSLV